MGLFRLGWWCGGLGIVRRKKLTVRYSMESSICYIIRSGVVMARPRPAGSVNHKNSFTDRHIKKPTGRSRQIHRLSLGREIMSSTSSQRAVYARIRNNPRFTELVAKRQGFATVLSIIVLTIFYGFFMVVAFNPKLIGQRLSESSYVTVGIAAELFMFVFFWLLTAFYVKRANGEFDAMTTDIIRDAAKEVK
jgi:uncharacterized membrane protein (DUF485 family)